MQTKNFFKVVRQDQNYQLFKRPQNPKPFDVPKNLKQEKRGRVSNKHKESKEADAVRIAKELSKLENEIAPADLVEENLRRQKRYFGSTLKYNIDKPVAAEYVENDRRLLSHISSHQRNPTLGEIVRGEVSNCSKRSLQEFCQKRCSTNYSSERNIVSPPVFSDRLQNSEEPRQRENSRPTNNRPAGRHPAAVAILTENHKLLMNSKMQVKNLKDTDQDKGIKNMWIEAINKEKIKENDAQVEIAKKTKNINRSPHKRVFSITGRSMIENALYNRNSDFDISKGLPDHPERDSLDGNLPSSSTNGTSNGNPPPAPAVAISKEENNNPEVSVNPEGSAQNGNFSKGPNSRNKKHKRLKNETSGNSNTLDIPHNNKNRGFYKQFLDHGGYRQKTEPYTYLWVVLSRMYGTLIVLLMLAFCLTEVLDNKVAPLTFQEIFILYLYVGSIIAIMCIYVTVIIDNCPSITSSSRTNLTKSADPEVGSISSFGTLKAAHISRSKIPRTSFYLRVGAVVFGLGTLIYNGLEIAMHSSIPENCISNTMLAHPIMQALFTFLQMHFLFVNSEVIVEKFGQMARFGFMHLVATNVALWIRMIVWESANDSVASNDFHTEDWAFSHSISPVYLGFHSSELQKINICFRNNTLGELWSNSKQYLFPIMVQYSLIAACVTYVMWQKVGRERLSKLKAEDFSNTIEKRRKNWKVDCSAASKGLFLGLLVLVGGVVILIIFFVMKDKIDFRSNLFWMTNGTMIVVLSGSIVASVFGFVQIPKLSIATTKPMALDRILISSTIVGVYIFALFSMIVGGIDYHNSEKFAIFCYSSLLLIQVSLQGMLVAEASRRTCANRLQMVTKPGRQVITFLLFTNVTLWALDTFMTYNSISQQFQKDFYGEVIWGLISRISLPLTILFRFHSAVILVQIWKNTYRTKYD